MHTGNARRMSATETEAAAKPTSSITKPELSEEQKSMTKVRVGTEDEPGSTFTEFKGIRSWKIATPVIMSTQFINIRTDGTGWLAYANGPNVLQQTDNYSMTPIDDFRGEFFGQQFSLPVGAAKASSSVFGAIAIGRPAYVHLKSKDLFEEARHSGKYRDRKDIRIAFIVWWIFTRYGMLDTRFVYDQHRGQHEDVRNFSIRFQTDCLMVARTLKDRQFERAVVREVTYAFGKEKRQPMSLNMVAEALRLRPTLDDVLVMWAKVCIHKGGEQYAVFVNAKQECFPKSWESILKRTGKKVDIEKKLLMAQRPTKWVPEGSVAGAGGKVSGTKGNKRKHTRSGSLEDNSDGSNVRGPAFSPFTSPEKR